MGIEPNFSMDDVRKRFDNFLAEVHDLQIEALQELGEQCVAHARSIPKEKGFGDVTGNLRSSIGYAIFDDGVAIHTTYNQVLNGVEGVKAGEALAKKVGSETKGVCLVVTAGMNYAIYVEAKGRDVLTSAEHLAARELPRMIAELVSNIKEATK